MIGNNRLHFHSKSLQAHSETQRPFCPLLINTMTLSIVKATKPSRFNPAFISIFAVLVLLPTLLPAQDITQPKFQNKTGSIYFYWGYNRSIYSTSDLHFSGPNYDFTVYDATASDRPTNPSLVYVNPLKFTIPQFNVRMGYFITKHIAASLGYDHMKYVMDQGQERLISGIITEEASSEYAGTYLQKPIVLSKDFLVFEHSDGLNVISTDLEYMIPLCTLFNDRLTLRWNSGIGGIWVLTRTDVRVMGDGINNDFKFSGYSMQIKTGPRLELKDRLFFLTEMKGGYASLPSVPIKNGAPEAADHNFGFLEFYFATGVYFRAKRKKKKNS